MIFLNTFSDDTVLLELGSRIAQYRLNRNLTQAALAKEAGVSLSTVNRIEAGQSAQLSNLIRLLRALDLLENLDALVPAPPASPIQQLKLKGKTRQRASSGREAETGEEEVREAQPWSWDPSHINPPGESGG